MSGRLPLAATMIDPVQEVLMPEEPFFWGDGGARVSPQEVAERRAMGLDRMARGSDTSPIGHWTQGLARVADGVLGGLDVRNARRDKEANDALDAEIRSALLGQDVSLEMLGAAIMDPAASDATRGYASTMLAARQPKERQYTPIEKLMLARGIQEGSDVWNQNIDTALDNELDPFVNFQGPGIGYSGRQSGLSAAMGGGDQSSGGPRPGDIVDGYRFKGGDPNSEASWEAVSTSNTPAPDLGANGLPAQLTRAQYQAVVEQMGRAETEAWARRNNIRVVD